MRKPTMNRMLIIWLVTFLAPAAGHAERSQDFGEYVVHFNAISTHFLAPEVAGNYGIRRSPSQALINVAVLKKVTGHNRTASCGKCHGNRHESHRPADEVDHARASRGRRDLLH